MTGKTNGKSQKNNSGPLVIYDYIRDASSESFTHTIQATPGQLYAYAVTTWGSNSITGLSVGIVSGGEAIVNTAMSDNRGYLIIARAISNSITFSYSGNGNSRAVANTVVKIPEYNGYQVKFSSASQPLSYDVSANMIGKPCYLFARVPTDNPVLFASGTVTEGMRTRASVLISEINNTTIATSNFSYDTRGCAAFLVY